jgi:2-dehydropantoate 2-reductase
MEIKKVAVIGAGAVGAYFIWGLENKINSKEIEFCVVADGERKERLSKNGVVVNGTSLKFPVKTADEAGKVDLVLIATKYGALADVLEDVKKLVADNTIVISLLNGVDSEEIVAGAIGEKNIVYSFMRIASERKGNNIVFNPKVTLGVFIGEKNSPEKTDRLLAIEKLFENTGVLCNLSEDIIKDQWEKYALNLSRNLPQAIADVGTGAYDDSEHLKFISKKIWDEVKAVALAKGISIKDFPFEKPDKNIKKTSRYSTLQDLMAKRHTEVDMLAGAMVKMGQETNVPVPYSEYTYHMIKVIEEKNDGLFDYTATR